MLNSKEDCVEACVRSQSPTIHVLVQLSNVIGLAMTQTRHGDLVVT